MEENNKEIKQGEVQVTQQETANTVQECNNETKFTPLGEIKEKGPKKKKGKPGVIIFILLLIVAIIGGLAYYYFNIYTNPKVVYQQILKTGLDKLTQSSEEITTLKTKAKLDMDVDIDEIYMEEDIEAVLNLINNTQVAVELQMDTNEKKALVKLDSTYQNEELVKADMLFDAKNKGTYVKIDQFFEDVLEVELEDKYYDELYSALELEEEPIIDRAKVIKILNDEFAQIIKDEYCSKENEKITINAKEINANKYILKMTNAELVKELKTVCENLKNNDEFLNCFKEKEETKETLINALEEIEAINTEEQATIYVKIYRTGLKQKFVRIDFEIERDEQKLILKVEKSEEEYQFKMSFEEETYFTGTLKLEQLDEKTNKLNLKVEVDAVGTIAANMEYGCVVNEAIETMDVENAVNIDELTEADTLRATANLLDSKLYEVLEEFSAISEDIEINIDTEVEEPDTDVNETTSELQENISSSAFLTEGGIFIAFAKNDNTVAVDMEIEVEYYDENGVILGSSSEDLVAVGAGREVAIEMLEAPDNFATYKIYVDVQETSETQYFDQIEITHNNNGENVVVQVKNNSEETIEFITVSVVYYNEGNIVGIAEDIVSDIKPGRSGNFTLYYPYNSEYEDVEFDDYKVYVTEAYSYEY